MSYRKLSTSGLLHCLGHEIVLLLNCMYKIIDGYIAAAYTAALASVFLT